MAANSESIVEDRESSSSSMQSPLISVNFPSVSVYWTREHLLVLNINIEEGLNPNGIVDVMTRRKFGKSDTWRTRKANLDARIDKIAEAVKGTLAFQLLDNDIHSLTMRDNIVTVFATREEDMWKINHLEEGTRFKELFQAAGSEFTERLLYCIEHNDNGEKMSKHMYQHLFISFLRLFGIKCQFEPIISKASMKIKNCQVCGTPDIIANWLRKTESVTSEISFEWKTLFLCKMKKEHERDDTPPAKMARPSTSMEIRTPSIPDELLGQFGVELLMHFNSSAVEDSAIGMIIEETHVTLASLSMTKQQYKEILEKGSATFDSKNGPKLSLTKSYNYLVKKDREYLLEAFLKLGYLQKYGSDFFK